jgi:hypothetical protein
MGGIALVESSHIHIPIRHRQSLLCSLGLLSATLFRLLELATGFSRRYRRRRTRRSIRSIVKMTFA